MTFSALYTAGVEKLESTCQSILEGLLAKTSIDHTAVQNLSKDQVPKYICLYTIYCTRCTRSTERIIFLVQNS